MSHKFVYKPDQEAKPQTEDTADKTQSTTIDETSNQNKNNHIPEGTLILPPGLESTPCDCSIFGSFSGPIPGAPLNTTNSNAQTTNNTTNSPQQSRNMKIILGHRVNIPPSKPNQ